MRIRMALSYAEFAKIQAHLILQTGQENTLVSRMPISNERSLRVYASNTQKKRCVPVALFGVRAIGSTMKKRRSYTAFLRKATSKMWYGMMPDMKNCCKFVAGTTGGCHLFLWKKKSWRIPRPCTEPLIFRPNRMEHAPKPKSQASHTFGANRRAFQSKKRRGAEKARVVGQIGKTEKTRSLLGEPFFPKDR